MTYRVAITYKWENDKGEKDVSIQAIELKRNTISAAMLEDIRKTIMVHNKLTKCEILNYRFFNERREI